MPHSTKAEAQWRIKNKHDLLECCLMGILSISPSGGISLNYFL